MSTSRETLRQAIGIRTSQPFFTRFGGDDFTASATGTTTTLLDTAHLKEADNFWRGQYIWFNDSLEVREVSAFANSTSTLTWLAPIAAATTTATNYELWSTFSPVAVNEAINDALRDAWPYFFDTATENLAILDTVAPIYTLPTATHTIRNLYRVSLMSYDSFTGEATSDGSTTSKLTDTAQTFVSATHVGQIVVIYDGDHAAAGDIRTISAVDSTSTISVSAAFTSTITDGTRYRIYDPDSIPMVVPLTGWRVDALTNPTTLWLEGQLLDYAGCLLRLEYEYEYEPLTTEAGTTTCPREFVILSALARLYIMKIAYAPSAEVRAWDAMQRATATAAQQYARRNRFQHSAKTVTSWYPERTFASDYPFTE